MVLAVVVGYYEDQMTTTSLYSYRFVCQAGNECICEGSIHQSPGLMNSMFLREMGALVSIHLTPRNYDRGAREVEAKGDRFDVYVFLLAMILSETQCS